MAKHRTHDHGSVHHSLWAPEHSIVVAPTTLTPGDHLDRDGTTWMVAGVDPLDDGSVVVAVQRTSCNGLPGRYRLRLGADTPLVGDGAPPGRRHVRTLGAERR
jgi:hypothetical protein